MTKDEALKLALNALLWANIEINDWRYDGYGYKPEDQPQIMEAITAIKQALAQPAPVQEPVAWIEHEWSGSGLRHLHFERREQSVRDEVMNPIWTPLYTTPPAAQRQWVGLTFAEICECEDEYLHKFARAIEAKLKEKNT